MWPKDMESVIELAIQRLNLKRDQAEVALKTKSVNFDVKLKRHEKILAVLKKKDPPILTKEEMVECVELVEDLAQKLQVLLQKKAIYPKKNNITFPS